MNRRELTKQIDPSRTLYIALQPLFRNFPRHIVPRVPPDSPDTRLVVSCTNGQDDDHPTPTCSEEGEEMSRDDTEYHDSGIVVPTNAKERVSVRWERKGRKGEEKELTIDRSRHLKRNLLGSLCWFSLLETRTNYDLDLSIRSETMKGLG